MTEGMLREPYATQYQQHQAARLGMFLFLASEVMLFGGLFAVVMVMRVRYPHEVVAASERLHVWLGAANTAILLTSSLLVAIAVEAARQTRVRPTCRCLGAAAFGGLLFLALKAVEYASELDEGILPVGGHATDFANVVQHRFMNIYLIATALHAVHVTVGVILLAGLAGGLAAVSSPLPKRIPLVENAGLYWHLVDIIWIFLYPTLYLAR
ncbi:MAG: cytochrome c oxidase subunit 3 [Pseudomonadota bacterium]